MCMCIHLCTYKHVYIYVSMHIYVYIYLYFYIYMYISAHICVGTYREICHGIPYASIPLHTLHHSMMHNYLM